MTRYPDYDWWNAKRASKPYPATLLAVDATFAPPPLQYPLKHGVDVVFHSSTKFLGGHSDLLGGVLCMNSLKLKEELLGERSVNGWNMGSLEAWLLLRSLRTLEIRVKRQAESAFQVVRWLSSKSEPCLEIVSRVWHTSLPGNPGHEAAKRLLDGPGPGCFAVDFKSPHHARLMVQRLKLFGNATSLGGVESLAEWRFAVGGLLLTRPVIATDADSNVQKTTSRVRCWFGSRWGWRTGKIWWMICGRLWRLPKPRSRGKR
jgi:cystathionine gamma-synthase